MTFTAHDLVDHLLTSTGGGAQDGEHRAVRQAVIHGAREVMQCRSWLWHVKTGQFTTQQISTTATAITAGSPVITVASTTGMVADRILDVPPGYFDYTVRIVSINGNNVTLNYPAKQTKPALQTVTVLVQTYYDLPANVKDIDALVTDANGTLHCYITPQEWQRLEVNTRGSGEPYYYTIMRSDVNPDRYQVRFVGVPQNGTVIYYTYRYIPESLKYMGYELLTRKGAVTPVAGTPMTVTGNGTNFAADMVGAMIRVGTVSTEPEPVGSLAPFVGEAKITAVNTATQTLTISGTLPTTAGVKYCITDVVDASPQMYTAIISGAEMWYARLAGKPAADAVALFNRDLRIAMENDVISPLSGRPRMMQMPTYRSMGWKSAQLPDQG
ncbi:MAG: hypothetical protein ACK52I_26325 [Pseudomonadota bacterium]